MFSLKLWAVAGACSWPLRLHGLQALLLEQVEQRQLGPHLQGLLHEQFSPHWPQAFLLQVLQEQEESQLQLAPQLQPSARRSHSRGQLVSETGQQILD